ncbi:M48 family metalloprotease [Bradyrhizobium sp. INPA01-394B]|uniref:M48 family metalloprotease n=1 Tax=Bradyrhizobium campsiandrae TaxID=1729892 RepID=A0ABR7U5H5_9BRAD|nr:M48 family metallopeptidase [Bradyrhizobium campsiandrae]MBC9879842.1 M48 family metalloprotease [Bradyrhizobium campsiandrae]MBC9978825.1 M48 family metalloprotease [Bradyrhizobium campsiandrae]
MNRLVLNIILRLGRYAVLPVVALAFVILAIWLLAMDRYTIAVLATAPIVFSMVLGALALAIGLLLLPSRKHRDFEADEETAPGLWAIWKELDPSFVRSRRTLLIDTRFNASIGEVSRYAGLFGQHVTMTVGLPMLIVLDEPAVRAIIAHEVAHAELRHTSGAVNLADFIAASENVFLYANPERTITGRILRVLLHSMLERLEREYRALSRENELHADLGSAARVGRTEAARALVLMEACGTRLTDLVYSPLEKEVLGAINAPRPPFERIFKQLADIWAPEPIAAAAKAGLTGEHEPDSTHPPFAKRLANLGYDEIPEIDEISTSAIDQLLSRDAARDIATLFDAEWTKTAQAWVTIGR